MAGVRVDLGQAGYDIEIGPGMLHRLAPWLISSKLTRKALIISDDNVSKLYGPLVLEAVKAAGFQAEMAVVAPGEEAKSMETTMELYTEGIRLGLDRQSPVIALGGGVIGDLAGFIAATYLRGVPFVQLPTTLLAQVDSSVGGKVAVNHTLGKNLIGAFYQPRLVLIDTDVLVTLPDREWRAGLAEVVKYGVIGNKRLFHFLEDRYDSIVSKDRTALNELIVASCRDKADIVRQDEHENGIRITLNFGHTIGHAIEAGCGFGRFNHGEAVAIGMHGAALISQALGLCQKETVNRIRDLLLQYGLPLTAKGCRPHALLPYLYRDKKALQGRVNWVLVKEIGEVTVCRDVPESVITQVLEELT